LASPPARPRTPHPSKVTSARPIPGVGLGVLLRNADMIFNRALREELARHDITFSQFQHLWQLFGSEGLTQVDLSHRIGIEAASSTAVINQLEKRRLIRRKRDAIDRRRINVTLTSAGRALEKPLTKCAMRVNKIARDGLSKAEIDVLFAGINRVIRNLRSRGS
jgi:MarR family transcriptional regulator, organic hydroperoxide resistance regulator